LRLYNPTDALAPWAIAPAALPAAVHTRGSAVHTGDSAVHTGGSGGVDLARAAAAAQAAALGQDVSASCFDAAGMDWG